MRDYQQDGFVRNDSKNALTEANRQIAIARNSTPKDVRHLYRSQIRFMSKLNGYAWYWVRK